MDKKYGILLLAAVLLALPSCAPHSFTEEAAYPPIFPDYVGVTVPDGIAPLTFRMEDGRKFRTEQHREGDVLWTTVSAWKRGDRQGVRYAPFPIYLSHDPIDPYIAYRLIEPGYESWRNMGIWQREPAGFDESAIVTNRANNLGCVNCHTFENRSPERMLFHARGQGGGTVFIDGDQARILNLATVGPHRQGTYPAWNPGGRYVVFSSNNTRQCFTVRNEQPIEVYDTDSDLIVYDSATDSVQMLVESKDRMETFPAWSPDGGTLYWCEAIDPGHMPQSRGKMHYRLMAAPFAEGTLCGEPREIWGSDSLSCSFPPRQREMDAADHRPLRHLPHLAPGGGPVAARPGDRRYPPGRGTQQRRGRQLSQLVVRRKLGRLQQPADRRTIHAPVPQPFRR